jgi:hypothetical protein
MIWLAHVEWGLADDMRRLWAKIAIWFDPDRDWRSADKIMHAFGGFAVCLLSLWLVVVLRTLPFVAAALVLTMIIGLVYEFGQADVAHSQRLLGKPGYGIGLVDLTYDAIGALILLAFRFTLRML